MKMKQLSQSIAPPSLKAGDKIGLVCTARKISAEELDFAITTLKAWGLEPVLGATIRLSLHQFAGDDWERAKDMQRMMEDDSIKAILCARGGYGSVRIIDKLDFAHFKKNPKWIIGYSDITVFHAHIHTMYNIETIHSTMPLNFKTNTVAALETLRDALFGTKLKYDLLPHELNIIGEGTGQLVGGNLSVLYSICGSRSDIDTRGKVLFLEDLDEYLYHIDRMMMQLKRSGNFRYLAGMVVGGFTKMKDNEIPYGQNALEIISSHVKDYNFPVAFDFPAGHIEDNRALIIGRTVHLDVDSAGVVLKFL